MKARDERRSKQIFVVSSEVVVGRVGISVIEPAFAHLGMEGFFLPTILLASRPGLGTLVRCPTAVSDMQSMLSALQKDGFLQQCDGVLTGYFADADQVDVVADVLEGLRSVRPALPVIVDPVIGDEGTGLFVSESTAEAIRDRLLPLADHALPNRFELGWLSATIVNDADGIDRAARKLGIGTVVVTSAGGTDHEIETRLVTPHQVHVARGRRHSAVPNGTGDLFAGLYAAEICSGTSPENALRKGCRALETVAAASAGRQWLDLSPLQETEPAEGWVAGVDGCRKGWAVVFRDLAGKEAPRFRRVSAFGEILDAPENPRFIAVDMPIGLPARTGAGGRGPEAAVRKHLGERQSSVFSIPSRQAVYAEDYRAACALALETSDPPRKVSKQGFMLFEKIREIDRLMTPTLSERVFEVHPELAFWRLNGNRAMEKPKKIKGKVNPDGLLERRSVLEANGFPSDFFDQKLPSGVGADDFLDASACALIAERLAQGRAEPFPAEPATDEKGLTIAIWA